VIRFDINAKGIDAATRFLAEYSGKLPDITARSLNITTKTVGGNMLNELDRRIDRPTNWTRRGLLRRYASPQNLYTAIGFNYGDGSLSDTGFSPKGMGTPAGKYMQTQAAGGTRPLKGVERKLAGMLSLGTPSQLRPTGEGITAPDSYGNVKRGAYNQMLSRLRANPDTGSTSNAPKGPGSRGRSGAKRRDTDLFMLGRGGRVRSIVQRVGQGPKGGTGKGSGNPGRPQTIGYKRGYVVAWQVTRPQRYRSRFPLQRLALADFNRLFPDAFRNSTEAAIRRAGQG
jgi:hypothetical protein